MTEQRDVTLPTIVRFGAVGVLNTLLDVGCFLLLARVFDVPVMVANSISYSIGLTNSFVCNKLWTFGSAPQSVPVGRQFVLFVALNLAGLAISSVMVATLQPLGLVIAKLISVPVVFAWNYWTNRRFVYRT